MIEAHVDDLFDGYLLDALEPAETAAARRHVASCGRCRRLLAASRDVLAVLPDQLEEIAPRPAAKLALLAAVRADAAPPEPPRRLLPFRMDARSTNPLLRWASLGMAAAFIIGLVGGVTGWALVFGDRMEKKDADLEKSRDTLETVVHSQRLFRMDGAYQGRAVRALVAVPPKGQAVLVVSDLPQAPPGQAYRLWFFATGTATAGGVLRPDTSGDAIVALAVDLAAFDRMEIALQSLAATAPDGVSVVAGSLH